MFQFLLSNSWLLIPIIIGLFNVGVRVQQKAKEQQARRAAQTELTRRKAEALRTGRISDESLIVYDEPNQSQAAKTPAQERQERIEALRKQRMEQLRAMREKRASIGTSAAPTRKPAQMPRPMPSRTAGQSAGQSRGQSLGQSAGQRAGSPAAPTPRANQYGPTQQGRPKILSGSRQKPSPHRPNPGLTQAIQVPRTQIAPPSTRPVSADAAATMRELRDDRPNNGSMPTKKAGANALVSIRDQLHDRKRTRQAILLREVLNAPVALRDPTTGPGNIGS